MFKSLETCMSKGENTSHNLKSVHALPCCSRNKGFKLSRTALTDDLFTSVTDKANELDSAPS